MTNQTESFGQKKSNFLAQCPKNQNAKKSVITFSEEPFVSSKSPYEQVEGSTVYLDQKVLSNSQNFLALNIRHWWKKLRLNFFSIFALKVPLDTWTCSLSTPSSFSWGMAEVYLCQKSESQRRSCNFFEKGMSNWSYGQVERSFDTIAGKNDIRSKIFAPCLKLILKSTFFSKISFFSKETFIWARRMQFWQPGQLFRGNANWFLSISDADKKQKETKRIFFKKS